MRVAAIDLGTNSFLCLIVEKHKDSYKVLADEIDIVRLGQGLAKNKPKYLQPEALERAKVCLERFRDKVDLLSVDKVLAVATSAARDAENKQDLVSILEQLKLPLKIISGEEEARLTFKGAMLDQNEDTSMVIDIGGGSTEFLYLENEKLVGKSLDLGGVRLTEMFLLNEIPTPAEMQAMTTHIHQQLESLPMKDNQKTWVAVAGTPTTLASMYLGLRKYDEAKIHNLKLHVDDIARLQKKLLVSLEQRKNIVGLDPKRADIIIAATTILVESMRKFKVDEIIISTKGIRYGLMKELLG